VGALAAMTALEGAYYNVRINLPTVTDEAFKKRVTSEAAALFGEAQTHVAKARAALEQGLSG
jgi:formiminotetrahydrofolate cyclodeaminase